MQNLKLAGAAAAALTAVIITDIDSLMAQPGAPVLAPHRAVYDIKLDQSRGGSGVSDMSGRMVYELTGSHCEGYTQTMRFVTRMTNSEGATSISDMRSSSWEDALAKSFRFSSSQYKDTKLSDQTQGDASRTSVADSGKIELKQPKKKEITLRNKVYFPIQHSIALLAAAQKGDTLFQADVYDGSEKGEKIYATTSYIGRSLPAGHNKKLSQAGDSGKLDPLRSWPVSISYFEDGSENKDAVPSYELAFLYFENGVSQRLFIDYGDFAIRGELKDLTFLDTAKCDKPAPGPAPAAIKK